jgi:hypothetical protein
MKVGTHFSETRKTKETDAKKQLRSIVRNKIKRRRNADGSSLEQIASFAEVEENSSAGGRAGKSGADICFRALRE